MDEKLFEDLLRSAVAVSKCVVKDENMDEIKLIKTWLAIRAKIKLDSDAFFVSERRTVLSRKRAWAAIRHYGELAGISGLHRKL